jgi:hypothetical protein
LGRFLADPLFFGPQISRRIDAPALRVAKCYVPGGPERLAEEFVKLSTEGEGVNRSTAQQNRMFAELNEKYDTEFVGAPL